MNLLKRKNCSVEKRLNFAKSECLYTIMQQIKITSFISPRFLAISLSFIIFHLKAIPMFCSRDLQVC